MSQQRREEKLIYFIITLLSVVNGTLSSSYVDSYRRPDIEQMQKLIQRYNELQSILNEDIFGPLENDSVLIVVQVHTRINYLRHLIVSLAQARDISRSLVIFSHDFYDEDINDLIQSIDFCKVMQVSFDCYNWNATTDL